MEVILTQRCKSLTGTVGSRFGYYIRSTKKGRFFSQRSRYCELPEAHWFFIVTCAELAKLGLHIADIKVSQTEVLTALRESGRGDYLWKLRYPSYLHATDVLNLKQELGL